MTHAQPSKFLHVWRRMQPEEKRALTALVGSSYATMSQYANLHIWASSRRANKIANELKRIGYPAAKADWLWPMPEQEVDLST